MLVSIIIPTLNEESNIRRLAASLDRLRGRSEVIIADGGSLDGTVETARACGLKVVESARGRGPQMNAGAQIAMGDALLFLHADTQVPDDALVSIAESLRDARVCGGNFSLVFDGKTWESRALTFFYPFLHLL